MTDTNTAAALSADPRTDESPDDANRSHAPHLEQWAYNQMPKHGERDLRLMRFDGTDLYAWFGKVNGSVFEDLLNGPFVIRPAPAALEGSSSSEGEGGISDLEMRAFHAAGAEWTTEAYQELVRDLWRACCDGSEVVPALHPSSAADAKPVAWRWRFHADDSWHLGPNEPGKFRFGQPDDIEPLYAQPHPSQQAGAEELAVVILRRLFDEKRPGYHDCIDAGEMQCAWCDAEDFLAALKPVEG